jgi:tetratricopeptide (TPR) repeat protein
MDRGARLLGERFEGLVIALVPEHVADVAAWRESISVLVATRWALRLRIAVLAPPGGALADVLVDEGARFQVDSDTLLAFLKDFSPGASAGPPAAEEAQAGEAQAAPHAAGPGAKLRSLLLDAAAELSAGRAPEAVGLYREARALCLAEGLVEQEAAVLIALGGACLASGAPEVGAESYRHAAVIAEGAEAWPLACQAWLGMGGAYLPRAEYAPAAVAFRAAAEAAKRADVVPLRIEALRMAGTCLLHLGREDDAMLAWKAAVDVGAEVDAAERGASTFEEVGRALAKLLERRGLARQAEHVRALIERPAPMEQESEAR